jgi:glutamate dehydrogenase
MKADPPKTTKKSAPARRKGGAGARAIERARRRPVPRAAAKSRVLRRLVEHIRRRHEDGGGALAARFAEHFYRHVAAEDVLERDESALAGAALSALELLRQRAPGEAALRVFTPPAEDDDFAGGHSVVEIVTDDVPFLVDSVTGELNRTGITVHLAVHPVVRVRRDGGGRLTDIVGLADDDSMGAATESVMQFHIDRHSDADALDRIADRLRSILSDVRASVADWQSMRDQLDASIAEIEASKPPISDDEVQETIALLRWLANDHFMFVGYREYDFPRSGAAIRIEIVPGSGLGILRNPSVTIYDDLLDRPRLPPEIGEFILSPSLVMVGKANRRSTVQRTSRLDTIALRRFDAAGRVIGGRLFAGLFTSIVFTSSPRQIPVLRRKVAAVLDASGFPPKSHDGRGLLHILETLPRDELFQFDAPALLDTSLGILRLRDRQRVALFVHREPLGRSVSCFVYVPRDRFDTRLRKRLGAIISEGFGGTLTAFQTSISSDPMARVHFVVQTTPGVPAPRTTEAIEHDLIEASRDWRDDLRDHLVRHHGGERGRQLFVSYGDAFPIAYRVRFGAADALSDIIRVAEALDSDSIVVDLYRSSGAAASELRLKLYRRDRAEPLSDVLPILENMGVRVLDEVPHCIAPFGTDHVAWMHDFGLVLRSGADVDLAAVKALFEDAMRRVWQGQIDNDGFNALVLSAGLSWRRIVILRAYCKFLLQAGIPFSQTYMESTLVRHPAVARRIVELFETLFDPVADRDAARAVADRKRAKIERDLDDVQSLDEDRILRRFLNAVTATLRTNYFQADGAGAPKGYLSVKLDSGALEELPLPRPFVEVFVHSSHVDAVHLRGGKVARGGIRWSDRREDFRSEVLGLMKSQMTKNAVIVPVGAKGGFVAKRRPGEGRGDAVQREGIECYKTMIRGLLDITDNMVDDRVVSPPDVVCRDGADPYLVVAADKGTASFSDIANGVASEYGYWLGDAFASGGSAGYDHKAMGITARGAWESIKRHFREMGVDAMASDFTCVGVGDMSGDVFGNGALYSPHMRLLAAFNHLHIFVDPAPDAATSFAERRRLFDLPRSSWADYDRALISRGGGVYARSAKAIRVTPAMRTLFDLGARATVTPAELIRAILRCEVDLLFFGGIGTYVRSSVESDAEVGDRSNDATRVRGQDVRAKIIAEGANLAVTQRGRIEFARRGGRINTDFIDNSAGVDCSDHEVNIKIALRRAIAQGSLTRPKRDRLLVAMTDEVAALVLRDNDRQSSALSEAERQGVALLDDHARFLAALDRAGRLDRAVEFLPSVEEIDERRAEGRGLTRPELAVLLAYAKIVLQEEVLSSDLPDDPHLVRGIGGYFPMAMRRRHGELLLAHPLRREITATYVANTIVNRTGPGFITFVQERTGAGAAAAARAYLVCRQVFRIAELWSAVDNLDGIATAALQAEMRLEILDLIKRGTRWFVRNGPQGATIDEAVAAYAPAAAALESDLDHLVPAASRRPRDRRAAGYAQSGAPHAVARRIASLDLLTATCDIVSIAGAAGLDPATVARAHYELGARLGIDWLRDAAAGLPAEGDRWRKAAILGVVDDLYMLHAELTTRVVRSIGSDAGDGERVAAWLQFRGQNVDRATALIAELRSAPTLDLSMLSVATAAVRALTSN